MRDLVVIGAGKFALEVTRYIGDVVLDGGAPAYRIVSYLSTGGEEPLTPPERTLPMADLGRAGEVPVVLALSDVDERRSLIDGFVTKHGLVAENIVHPDSTVEPAQLTGTGNVIGPRCYLGANVTLGSFNVINYHCTVGHHSRLGSNNFIAPNFHCGNSVEIGDDNLFGLSCTLGPGTTVGDDCRLQAGITLFDNARSGYSYLSPSRIKTIKHREGEEQ